MPAKGKNHLERAKQLRLRQPNREQITPVPMYLERILPDNHLGLKLGKLQNRQSS